MLQIREICDIQQRRQKHLNTFKEETCAKTPSRSHLGSASVLEACQPTSSKLKNLPKRIRCSRTQASELPRARSFYVLSSLRTSERGTLLRYQPTQDWRPTATQRRASFSEASPTEMRLATADQRTQSDGRCDEPHQKIRGSKTGSRSRRAAR